MKRIISLALVIVLMIGLTGCTNKLTENNNQENQNNQNKNSNNINESNNIVITLDGKEVTGVLLDTELASEIKKHFPLTVKMVKYGNREYYGGIDFEPTNKIGGKKSFEDGDITYCPQNNTLAIFYNGSEMPNLTMDVIKIGEVTSDLDVFYEAGSSEELTFKFAE